jgi:hypothetical protein
MVLRCTRLVEFEDILRLCRRIEQLLRRDLALWEKDFPVFILTRYIGFIWQSRF